jgi:preprotein translocase subunit SecG
MLFSACGKEATTGDITPPTNDDINNPTADDVTPDEPAQPEQPAQAPYQQQPQYYAPQNDQYGQPQYSQPAQQQYQPQPYDYNQAGYQRPDAYTNNIQGQPTQLTGAAKAFSIVSLVCGIASLGTCWLGIFFGIAAIVFSVLTSKKSNGVSDKKAKVGKILGIIGIVLSAIFWIVLIIISAVDSSRGATTFSYSFGY